MQNITSIMQFAAVIHPIIPIISVSRNRAEAPGKSQRPEAEAIRLIQKITKIRKHTAATGI